GAVPVAVSDAVKADQLAYYLVDTDASVLFFDGDQAPKLAAAVEGLDSVPGLVLVRGDCTAPLPDSFGARLVEFDTLLRSAWPKVEPAVRHANDIAYMLYSGSTTGPAKGVTHLAHDFVLVPERQGAFWEY